MKEYEVYYIGYDNKRLFYTVYGCLEKAMRDCLYWLNNSSVKFKLSYIKIYRIDIDIKYYVTNRILIAEINR